MTGCRFLDAFAELVAADDAIDLLVLSAIVALGFRSAVWPLPMVVRCCSA